MEWTVIQSPTDSELSAVRGAYLVADSLPLEDAHLIAASRDMLAALIALKPILDSAESNASGNPEWPYVSKRIKAAWDAIAKATGA